MNVCECGCGQPAGEGRKYVNNAHKQKAFRQRKRQKSKRMAKFAENLIWKMFDEDIAAQVSELLGTLKTPQHIDNVGAAIYLMLTEINRKGANNA